MRFSAGSIRYGLWITVLVCGVAVADELPSLFRGLVVGEGQPGAKIVLVREDAFAVAAGIRAGDHIVRIDDAPINSLNDFATVSQAYRGTRTDAAVTVVRGGTRFTGEISLTSPTVRQGWGIVFIPDYSMRFVEASAAHRYWSQRAADEITAGHEVEAMRSLLNVLHYAPEAYDEALALGEAIITQGERLWTKAQYPEALGVFQQALILYQQAAAKPLSARQWDRVQRSLTHVVTLLRSRGGAVSHAVSQAR